MRVLVRLALVAGQRKRVLHADQHLFLIVGLHEIVVGALGEH